jgi:hypothetical protein
VDVDVLRGEAGLAGCQETISRPSICCTTMGGSSDASSIVAPRSERTTLPSSCGCASMTRPCITSSSTEAWAGPAQSAPGVARSPAATVPLALSGLFSSVVTRPVEDTKVRSPTVIVNRSLIGAARYPGAGRREAKPASDGSSRVAATLGTVDVSVVISALSLLVALGTLLSSRHIWRVERKSDVRVVAQNDASGLDIYADRMEVQLVIAVRVFNHGEKPEYVVWTGLESIAGEPLVDDRPTAPKLVDDPAPEARELPPRGQLGAQFKLASNVAAEGFVGYAVLGTGKRVYSVPAMPDPGLAEIQADVMKTASEHLQAPGEDTP